MTPAAGTPGRAPTPCRAAPRSQGSSLCWAHQQSLVPGRALTPQYLSPRGPRPQSSSGQSEAWAPGRGGFRRSVEGPGGWGPDTLLQSPIPADASEAHSRDPEESTGRASVVWGCDFLRFSPSSTLENLSYNHVEAICLVLCGGRVRTGAPLPPARPFLSLLRPQDTVPQPSPIPASSWMQTRASCGTKPKVPCGRPFLAAWAGEAPGLSLAVVFSHLGLLVGKYPRPGSRARVSGAGTGTETETHSVCFWEGAGGGRWGPWGALEQEGTPEVTSQAQLGGPLAPVTQSQSSSPREGVRGKAALWAVRAVGRPPPARRALPSRSTSRGCATRGAGPTQATISAASPASSRTENGKGGDFSFQRQHKNCIY